MGDMHSSRNFYMSHCRAFISVPIQSLGWTVKNKIQTDWKMGSSVCEPFIPLRFFQLPLTPNRLSATLNNSLTVRAGLAHQLTDKYLKRKAVRWEQPALFTSQANTPLVCDGAWSCGALGLGEGGEDVAAPTVCTVAHICSPHQTARRTHAVSLIHLPTLATQMSPRLVAAAADETFHPLWSSSHHRHVLNHNETAKKAAV